MLAVSVADRHGSAATIDRWPAGSWRVIGAGHDARLVAARRRPGAARGRGHPARRHRSAAYWLAPLLNARLSASSGRPVRIDSAWVGLTPSLELVVQFRAIRIANAPWADHAAAVRRARQSAVAVVSWRSIEQRRPVIALMVLRDGEVDLERTADGLRNWRLGNPEYRGPGRYKVLALQAERATLRFLHAGIDLDLKAPRAPTTAPTRTAQRHLPTRIDLIGEWRQLRFRVSAATGPVLTFLETGRDVPLRGFLETGGARLDVDGRAGDIVRDPLIDAHVTLVAPSLAAVRGLLSCRIRRHEGDPRRGCAEDRRAGATRSRPQQAGSARPISPAS